jgi:formate dehydrogenase iron-sulfur subunit
MIQPSTATVTKTTLVDVTWCIGCRACQVACKNWNDCEGEQTELQSHLGLQNPASLSADTLTLITSHEIPDENAPGGLLYLFTMQRCLHCLEPACVSACPTTALSRLPDGPVSYDADKCIGCRYCIWACPWGVPATEWDSLAPEIKKCTHCADRAEQPSRIAARPGKYVDHVYGEKEAGGTTVVYLSSVPFEKLGFPTLSSKAFPAYTSFALHAVPPAVIALGTVLGSTVAALKRRAARVARVEPHAGVDGHGEHPEFEPIRHPLLTPFNWTMIALMAFGAISLIARFALGLGGSTNLSNTYAWGLWIVFDLVWIAVAAGAFATAGLIYVFRRKDLYSMGRSAVLMGLLSYSFVTVTLVADLGLPWNFWQLGLQAPEQSAMFEVSWCVGLYVTILLFEFLPVPLEHWGLGRAMEVWRRWSGAYVVVAVAGFVYLLSRSLVLTAAAAAVFAVLALVFRPRGREYEPVMLAIAAVTLSTMHQSSLGSLFLLMPDKLGPLWWSPVLPVSFFLSSIASGTALVIVVEMWIAGAWQRTLRIDQLASLGNITFWSLLVYLVWRLGDMALRGQLAGALGGRPAMLFLAEILLGGLVPLALLARPAQRARPKVLLAGALLTTLGVVLNRVNVVALAMNLKGARRQSRICRRSSSGVCRSASSPRPSSSSGSARDWCRYSPRSRRRPGPRPLESRGLAREAPVSPGDGGGARADRRGGGGARAAERAAPELGRLPRRVPRRCVPVAELFGRDRSRSRRRGDRRSGRTDGVAHTAGRHGRRVSGPGFRAPSRPRHLDPIPDLAAGPGAACAQPLRPAALPRLGGAGPVPTRGRARVQRLARRGTLAPQLLSHLRHPARDGAAGRHRPRAAALSGLWMLPDALALQANRLSLLRDRRPPAFDGGDRGGEQPENRLLRGVRRVSQDLQRRGERGGVPGRLDFRAPRSDCTGSRVEAVGGVDLRVVRARCNAELSE